MLFRPVAMLYQRQIFRLAVEKNLQQETFIFGISLQTSDITEKNVCFNLLPNKDLNYVVYVALKFAHE